MNSCHFALRGVWLFLCALGTASADIVYTFSGHNAWGTVEEFQYTAPTFIADNTPTGLDITKWTLVAPADLDWCTNCVAGPFYGAAVWFEPNSTDGYGIPHDGVRFYGNDSSVSLFIFQLGSFTTPGIYFTLPESDGDIATLQVSPEPSSQWLLVGFLSLIVAVTVWHEGRVTGQ